MGKTKVKTMIQKDNQRNDSKKKSGIPQKFRRISEKLNNKRGQVQATRQEKLHKILQSGRRKLNLPSLAEQRTKNTGINHRLSQRTIIQAIKKAQFTSRSLSVEVLAEAEVVGGS